VVVNSVRKEGKDYVAEVDVMTAESDYLGADTWENMTVWLQRRGHRGWKILSADYHYTGSHYRNPRRKVGLQLKKNPFAAPGLAGLWQIYGPTARRSYMAVVKFPGRDHIALGDEIGVDPWKVLVELENLEREGVVHQAGGRWYKGV